MTDTFDTKVLPNGWQWSQLGDLGEAVRGVTFAGGEGIPDPMPGTIACLTTSGVQDEINWKSRRFIPTARVANRKQILQNGDLLISTANSKELVGKSCLVKDIPFPCTFGAFVTVFRPNAKLNPSLLAYWMRTSEFLQYCYRASSNTTNISNLRTTELLELKIPLPPLPEQHRLRAILDRADRLRRMRRFARQMTGTFLQAVFVRMFGSYLLPGSPVAALGEVVKITGGGTPSRETARYYEGKIPWLTSKDMRGDYIYDTQEHISEEAIRESATNLVPAGSILIVVKSKILMHRLPLAIARVPLCHGQDIKSIQCSSKVNNLFVVQVLKYNEAKLLFQARGANTEGLTLPMLQEITVPTVPLALQEQFARIVQRFARLRAQQREAERQAEQLFQALLQRALSGEI